MTLATKYDFGHSSYRTFPVGCSWEAEMDGKNQFYNRPVLIVRKFNSGFTKLGSL